MDSKNTLLIATHNQDKFNQIASTLKNVPYTLVSLADLHINHDVKETGTTYEENVTLKAKTYAQLSGLMTLADDSGIEIDALNGEPGVYSARYAGPNKTTKERAEFILDKMKTVPIDKRSAQFTSILALADPITDNTKLYQDIQHGIITTELRGSVHKHFVYNTIFCIPEVNKTLAEMKDAGLDYQRYSARGIALNKVVADLI